VELEWRGGVASIRCAVCGRNGEQDLVAVATHDWNAWRHADSTESHVYPIEVARCRDCAAIVLGGVLPPSNYDGGDIDRYIEHFASIEALADMLAKAGAPEGSCFLDVGCGYGFALDVGQFIFGWKAIGLDPSVAAERGAAELGLDIRPGLLDDALEPDERFDVIFASEVLEHIPDPRSFLEAVRRRLSAEGVLILTTPNAADVRPETPAPLLHAVLSLTAHEFLVDAAGLTRLLEETGFSPRVWSEASGLRAVAGVSDSALKKATLDATFAPADVNRYLDARADLAPVGSSLALGMAFRSLKARVNAGDLEGARAIQGRVQRALLARYDIDLDDPESVQTLADPPTVLASTHYFTGLVTDQLLHDPRRAKRHFAAAAAASKARFDADGAVYADPETPQHEAIARSQSAKLNAAGHYARAKAELTGLEAAVARGAGDEELLAETRESVAAIRAPRARARRLASKTLGPPRRALRKLGQRATPGRPSSGRRA
jgi:SAM-dependent methyltransferase